MHFTKMHGLGNDYLYIFGEPKNPSKLAIKLSDRHFGAGSDGIICISHSQKADFKMRIFNADGSEAKMCGNGIRCAGKYLYDKGYTDKKHLSIETLSGIRFLHLQRQGGKIKNVTVEMGTAVPAEDIELSVLGETVTCTPVSVGNPHAVIFVKDINKAAVVCGLGAPGLHDKVIVPKYGTYMRFVYIITDLPLETDEPFQGTLCDNCGACKAACPGKAIDENGVDTWQCSVYYRGAHKSNPFMTEDFLAGNPEREAILNGDARFDAQKAQEIYPHLQFLPATHFGYMPCLCGKSCETICYKHLKEEGIL